MSLPTSTQATRCALPKSSPLLSSSFTPFYPRSQQQLYHLQPHLGSEGDFQAPVQRFDTGADQSHYSSWAHGRGSKLYDLQQYYSCPVVDPSEVSWFSNSEIVWDGCSWEQADDAGDFLYEEDDTGDSTNLVSGSLSYYAGSSALEKDIYVSTAGNFPSIPVLLPEKEPKFPNSYASESARADPKSSTSFTGSSAICNTFYSIVTPEQATENKRNEDLISTSRDLSEQAASGIGQQVPAKECSVEVATQFSSRSFGRKPFLLQVSSQGRSPDVAENVQAVKEGNVPLTPPYNMSKEQTNVNTTELRQSMSSALACPDTNEFADTSGRIFSTSFGNTSDILQKEKSSKSGSHHNGINQLHSSIDHCSTVIEPAKIEPQTDEQMNGASGFHQAKIKISSSQPDCSGLSFNACPHPLVECIYNLSKVLLCIPSQALPNSLNSSDCATLEDTLCMLSRRLLVLSASEANSYQEPTYQQVAEEPLKSSGDSAKGSMRSGSVQEDSSHLTNKKHIVPLLRDLQTGGIENKTKLTADSAMGGHKHVLYLEQHMEASQEELRLLRGEVEKLKEQVVYERTESNVTVSMYKELWNEAQEGLKVSRLEIWKIRSELEALKQEMVHLKESGHGKVSEKAKDKCSASLNGGNQEHLSGIADFEQLPPDLNEPSTEEEMNMTYSGSSKEVPEVLTGCLDKKIWENEICKDFERADSNHNDQAVSSDFRSKKIDSTVGGLIPDQASLAPTNLEHDVARRLSLLLSRQGLDLNKTCDDNGVDWLSCSGSVLEPPTDGQGEDKAASPANQDYLVWSETSYLVNGKEGPEYVSCDSLAEHESRDGRAVLKGCNSQEDEIEIICFKPGIVDLLKGESEWEDVAVNMINDLSSVSNELH